MALHRERQDLTGMAPQLPLDLTDVPMALLQDDRRDPVVKGLPVEDEPTLPLPRAAELVVRQRRRTQPGHLCLGTVVQVILPPPPCPCAAAGTACPSWRSCTWGRRGAAPW